MDRPAFESLLTPLVEALRLELRAEQVDKLWSHYCLLERWNDRVNLTAIRRPDEIVERHFGESLAVAKVIGESTGGVVDVGSGAGFPGVPVAVCFPMRKVTLVESVGKKATFLKEVARAHANIEVYCGRFEGLGGHFEWGCVRGVAAEEVGEHLVDVVERVALLVSGRSSKEISEGLGLCGVETHIVPWDPRTTVLTGRVGGST